MEMNTITLVTLNNLALANNDRMAAYEQAMGVMNKQNGSADGTDLLAFFSNYFNDSRAFSKQLALMAGEEFYLPDSEEKTVNMFTGTATSIPADRSQVLAVCYKGEEQTNKLYEYALDEEAISMDTKNILLRQKEEVLRAQKILESLLKRAA